LSQAVFLGTAVDGGRRRHRDEAVAVIGSVSIAERGSEIDAFGGDVLLIAVLPVEVENVFDGPEVAGFVWGSGCIFDVVEREPCSPAVVTAVRVSVPARWKRWSPLPCACFRYHRAPRRWRRRGLDQRFEKDCFEVLVSDGLGKRGER